MQDKETKWATLNNARSDVEGYTATIPSITEIMAKGKDEGEDT